MSQKFPDLDFNIGGEISIESGSDSDILLDASEVAPMLSWGTSPQQAVPIADAIKDSTIC